MTEEQIANLKHFEQGEFLKDEPYQHLALMGHDSVCGLLTHCTEFGMNFIEVFTPLPDGTVTRAGMYGSGAVYSIKDSNRFEAASTHGFTIVDLFVVCRNTGDIVQSGRMLDCLAFEEMESHYGEEWDSAYWLLTELPEWIAPPEVSLSAPDVYDPFCED